MSQDEARQLGFALVAVLVVLMIIGVMITVYFYTPSENGANPTALEAKKQAEKLNEQVQAQNEAKLNSYDAVATTSF